MVKIIKDEPVSMDDFVKSLDEDEETTCNLDNEDDGLEIFYLSPIIKQQPKHQQHEKRRVNYSFKRSPWQSYS